MLRLPASAVAGTRLGRSGLPILDEDDIHAGHPFGIFPGGATALPDRDPVAALRSALLPALLRPPCVIAFSGGRDSSVLLAHAADIAMRDSLLPPVAYTLRYPGDAAAEESGWQELVVGHLREHNLPLEWVHRDVGVELDLLGPLTAPVLCRHGGPVYPPAIGPTVLLSSIARGGSLVTGNFGDEVLGDHRAAVLRAVWRRRAWRMTREDWATTTVAMAPGSLRAALLRRRVPDHPWLRPPLREQVARRQIADATARPLRWDASVRAALRPRAVQIGNATRGRIARDHDCNLVEPLGEPRFVAALAAFGGRWGRLGRGAAVRLLGGELVPTAVAARTSKAYFNRSRFGPITRAFARDWDGSGVNCDLVDREELRRSWLSELPPASSALLLQLAWSARCGITP